MLETYWVDVPSIRWERKLDLLVQQRPAIGIRFFQHAAERPSFTTKFIWVLPNVINTVAGLTTPFLSGTPSRLSTSRGQLSRYSLVSDT